MTEDVHSMDTPDREVTTFEPIDWQERLGFQVAAHAARTAAKRAEREQLKRRRNAGLVRRYAEKTARLNRGATPTIAAEPTVARTATDEPRSQ